MKDATVEVIESTVGQIAAELARRGIEADRPVTVTVEPDDWLTRARRESRARVVAAGLSDEDIDRLIKEARREKPMRRCAARARRRRADAGGGRYECLDQRRTQGQFRAALCDPVDRAPGRPSEILGH